MKKIILITLTVALIFAFAGCVSDNTVEEKLPVTDIEIPDVELAEDLTIGETGVQKPAEAEVTLEEQVVYDENNIKVTVKGLTYDVWFGPAVAVLVENNSEQNITVQTRKSSINGLMIDTMFSCDVAAGKKANDNITFYENEMDVSNITTIKNIEFVLHIFDTDAWEDIDDSDPILLTTSADPDYVQECNTDGFVAYEDESYKIVIQKLDSDDSFWGSDIYVYIENNGEEDITVQARDVSINGFMIDPAFSTDITAGKKAFDTISFFQTDLEENGITDITELEIKFHIFDQDDWGDICDTDAITVKFE